MIKIIIDNKEYEVDPKKSLLESCLSLGLDLPYFCWHPAMGSVGACRQCGVKTYRDESDTKGKIVMACMEPVKEGMRVGVFEEEAKAFRAGVNEWMMTNHPHDCPVCDEGGECHLQDMTVMTGHNYRRFVFKKRTYRNQHLGPFINHEMNRCVQCYRCVRFYRDYAGGRDFDNMALRNHVYFGRHEDGVLENEFSGNLVEVCPTGVFTDKSLKKHFTRKWDYSTAPSICTNCSLGCNTITGERYGMIRRIRSRYNGQVNGYFICDRGRYGYEFVNDTKRIKDPSLRKENGNLEKVDKADMQSHVAKLFSGKDKVIGIGSPRASLESNFALKKLVGYNNFFQGISGKELKLTNTILDILQNGAARTPSLKEVEKADAVLILGEDLTNTAPMLALAVRQSIRQKSFEKIKGTNIPEWQDAVVRKVSQNEKDPLFIASLYETKLDDVATKTIRCSPDEIAMLGFEVASLLDNMAPKINDPSKQIHSLAAEISLALKEAKRPLIISGISCFDENILHAAANIAWALCSSGKAAELSFVVPEPNSLGTAMLGGKSLNDAFDSVEKGNAETVIILENDLYRRADKNSVDAFFNKCKSIIVLDSLENSTTANARTIIPVGTFAESDGTFVNNEGRAQRYYQAYHPSNPNLLESWRWLDGVELAKSNGKSELKSFNDFLIDIVNSFPKFEGIQKITPPPDFRIAGQKIPRQTQRYSGRTAMCANINVSEFKPPEDPDSPLSYTMEGYKGEPPSSLIPFYWSPGWNSVQAINKYQIEVGGELHGGDPGKRLIAPKQNAKAEFFNAISAPFKIKDGEFFVVPVYHIFGSEELSSISPSIAELAPEPYAAINPDDAEKLKIKKDDEINLYINNYRLRLPVKIKLELPKGMLGIPVGLYGMQYFDLPVWCKISGGNN